MIYVDTCLVIYAFEDDPVFGARARAALATQAPDRLAISPLVKFECLVAPMKHGNLVLQRYYEDGLQHFMQLDMPEAVFIQGAQLRARFGLKTPDALHLATAQHHGCDALWTHDERLAQAAHGLAINVLAP
jgi:uncharacterized protein